MSNCGSLVGRNYSIARMREHHCLWICKLLVQAVLENLRQSRPHPHSWASLQVDLTALLGDGPAGGGP